MKTPDCPTCGRPWPVKQKRICSVCNQPIKRVERYFLGPESRPQHHHCPTLAPKPEVPAAAQMVLTQEAGPVV